MVAYVANGGALMVMLDPGSPAPYLLERLGLSVPEGIVADKQVYFPFPDRPVVTYGRHNIVDDLREAGCTRCSLTWPPSACPSRCLTAFGRPRWSAPAETGGSIAAARSKAYVQSRGGSSTRTASGCPLWAAVSQSATKDTRGRLGLEISPGPNT